MVLLVLLWLLWLGLGVRGDPSVPAPRGTTPLPSGLARKGSTPGAQREARQGAPAQTAMLLLQPMLLPAAYAEALPHLTLSVREVFSFDRSA